MSDLQNISKPLPEGVLYYRQLLDDDTQYKLINTLRQVVERSPMFTPKMPRTGKPMSVQMTNCGQLGWVTDQANGYRYQDTHPQTGNPWPEIPASLLEIWDKVSEYPHPPQACLINYYNGAAKMGLHQDKDEENFKAPVVSISLGDTCLFRIGFDKRGGKTASIKLESGDVIILSGPSRLAFHGVDKIYPGTSDLLKNGGRINLTLRRVTEPPIIAGSD